MPFWERKKINFDIIPRPDHDLYISFFIKFHNLVKQYFFINMREKEIPREEIQKKKIG